MVLMVEMLRVFVQGNIECYCSIYLFHSCVHTCSNSSSCCNVVVFFFLFSEAAVRSHKQAESEDCERVDIEHFEKILPQLVREFALPNRHFSLCREACIDSMIHDSLLYSQ